MPTAETLAWQDALCVHVRESQLISTITLKQDIQVPIKDVAHMTSACAHLCIFDETIGILKRQFVDFVQECILLRSSTCGML